MATIADVGRRAGVTPSVVSRVLNGDPSLRVRPETRERVVAAARELDYTPNHAARALRQSRVGTIGLAVHDISNPVYAPLIAGAQRAASTHGYVLVLADVPELARDGQTFARVVGSGAIDGLLLLPAGVEADRVVEEAVAERLPAVVVNDRSQSLPSIELADRAAMSLATDHLLDLGHRDLAALRLDGAGHRARHRTEGFERAMRGRGVPVGDDRVIDGGHTVASGRAAMEVLLSQPLPPTGVVAASVLAGIGALTATRDAGLGVPDDLSIVGVHDVFFAEFLTPALTVVRLPLGHLGEVAVERLVAMIDGDDASQPHLLLDDPAPELVLRGSTAAREPRPDASSPRRRQ
jgi:LacI family transcriptional regulator